MSSPSSREERPVGRRKRSTPRGVRVPRPGWSRAAHIEAWERPSDTLARQGNLTRCYTFALGQDRGGRRGRERAPTPSGWRSEGPRGGAGGDRASQAAGIGPTRGLAAESSITRGRARGHHGLRIYAAPCSLYCSTTLSRTLAGRRKAFRSAGLERDGREPIAASALRRSSNCEAGSAAEEGTLPTMPPPAGPSAPGRRSLTSATEPVQRRRIARNCVVCTEPRFCLSAPTVAEPISKAS